MERLIRSFCFVALVATIMLAGFASAKTDDNPVNPDVTGDKGDEDGAESEEGPDSETCAQCEKNDGSKKAPVAKKVKGLSDSEIEKLVMNTLKCEADEAFVKSHGKNTGWLVYGPWMKACEDYLVAKSAQKPSGDGGTTALKKSSAPFSGEEAVPKSEDTYYFKCSGSGSWQKEWPTCPAGESVDTQINPPMIQKCPQSGQLKTITYEVEKNPDSNKVRIVQKNEVETTCEPEPLNLGLTYPVPVDNHSSSGRWKTVLAVGGVAVGGVAVLAVATYFIVKNRNEHPNVVNETRYVSEALTPHSKKKLNIGFAPMEGGGALVLQGSFGP